MHIFDKMHRMEKLYLWNTKLTYKNKPWKFHLKLDKYFSKYLFSKGKLNNSLLENEFELTVVEMFLKRRELE